MRILATLSSPAPALRWIAAPLFLASLAFPALAGTAPFPTGPVAEFTPLHASRTAVVNFAQLAAKDRLLLQSEKPPVRPRIHEEEGEEEEGGQNEYGEPGATLIGTEIYSTPPPFFPFVASPAPTLTFMGLDDIPMVDSSYIIIPPDVGGAVGSNRVLAGHNNNYRILNKTDGSVISTVGTATFWAPVVPASERSGLTDPRTVYDPYNNRWIAVMQTTTTGAGSILVAVSQTSDPAGAWNLFNFPIGFTIDFPIVGFNKNWISISINRYGAGGTFARGINLVVDYPNARAGIGAATLFTLATSSHFCSAPATTYSATTETLYVVTHLSSAGATYQLDLITGTSAAPAYTVGGSQTRAGGGWVQPGGNLLPQSAPNSGTSACGGTPCPIESQDAQVRSAPVYRGGFLYYAQTIGLPSSGLTHTAVQWTKLNTPSGTVADGGRIDDPTATSTNGGKWHAFAHVAVNANHDFMVGYSQFSSAQHPAAGYSMHLAGDAPGSIRDAVIYQPGEDYYHKTFSTTTGRNRWGDFTACQVDPADDMTLWTVQEYAKNRIGTNDGNTGSNGSRWSTWWAALAPPSVTIDAGPSQNEGDAGTSTLTFTARLSYAYGLPVTVNYQTSDGTATVADNDYQAANTSVIIPAGSLSANFQVTVNGDETCESNEDLTVTLTGANQNIPLGLTSATTATILNDDDASITATAGANGTISPPGTTVLACGADQEYTITPDAGYQIDQLLVDGNPATPAPTYSFNDVVANHTISVTFVATNAVDAGPVRFALGPVMPNPVRDEMQVSFGLPAATSVRVSVLDLQGREIAVLARGAYAPGWHHATWSGRNADRTVGAGLYFVRYQAAGRTLVKKFALAR